MCVLFVIKFYFLPEKSIDQFSFYPPERRALFLFTLIEESSGTKCQVTSCLYLTLTAYINHSSALTNTPVDTLIDYIQSINDSNVQ